MKAIGKNVVVAKIEEEVKTESGLLLSAEDASSFRHQKAEVIMPGTDVSHLNEGDVVYYDTSRAFTLVVNEKTVTIIQERDVVVVL